MKAQHLAALSVLFAVLALALASLPTQAGTIVIVNTDDCGPGSLRQAVADATSGDTISFNLTYPTTITLTSGEILLSKNLTFSGPGADKLRISGNNASRIFSIDLGITAIISGVTITKGKAEFGGGISTAGTLTITNSTFSRMTQALGVGGAFPFRTVS